MPRRAEAGLGALMLQASLAVQAQPHLLKPEELFTAVNTILFVSCGCVHFTISNEQAFKLQTHCWDFH